VKRKFVATGSCDSTVMLNALFQLGKSFGYAFEGLFYLLRSQRNARIEVCLGFFACALGAWLHLSNVEWAIIVFTIALVLDSRRFKYID